jgi:hypothetical protein
MKKFVLVSAISIASSVYAQASNFVGFSGAVNLNTASATSKLAGDGLSTTLGQHSINGSVQAAYGFALGASSLVSVGASYGLGKTKAGEITLDDGTFGLKAKNQMSLYLEPGFLAGTSTLVYGKLSYERAKGVSSFTGEPDESKNMKGTGYGFGVRTMLDKSSFIQVEVRQIAYKSIDLGEGASIKAKGTIGSVGFGLKF